MPLIAPVVPMSPSPLQNETQPVIFSCRWTLARDLNCLPLLVTPNLLGLRRCHRVHVNKTKQHSNGCAQGSLWKLMCAADQAMLTDASNGLFVVDVRKAHKLIRLILMKDKRLGHFKVTAWVSTAHVHVLRQARHIAQTLLEGSHAHQAGLAVEADPGKLVNWLSAAPQ